MSELLAWTAFNATAQTTTDNYADVKPLNIPGGEGVFEAPVLGPIRVTCQNTGANSITFQVLSSNDRTLADSLWSVAVAGAAVGAGAIVYATAINPAADLFYKVQVRATVAASQGAALVRIVQKRA